MPTSSTEFQDEDIAFDGDWNWYHHTHFAFPRKLILRCTMTINPVQIATLQHILSHILYPSVHRMGRPTGRHAHLPPVPQVPATAQPGMVILMLPHSTSW